MVSARLPARSVAIFLLIALPACTITFRRKPIEPLDSDRSFDAPIQTCWDSTGVVIEEFVPAILEKNFEAESDAGLIETDFAVLPDAGDDPTGYLSRVAFARGGSFIGGRYALTVTVRQVRGGQCKVKAVTRIEGYMGEEYGYQVLRSTGLIEEAIFARIGEELGTAPITE